MRLHNFLLTILYCASCTLAVGHDTGHNRFDWLDDPTLFNEKYAKAMEIDRQINGHGQHSGSSHAASTSAAARSVQKSATHPSALTKKEDAVQRGGAGVEGAIEKKIRQIKEASEGVEFFKRPYSTGRTKNVKDFVKQQTDPKYCVHDRRTLHRLERFHANLCDLRDAKTDEDKKAIGFRIRKQGKNSVQQRRLAREHAASSSNG